MKTGERRGLLTRWVALGVVTGALALSGTSTAGAATSNGQATLNPTSGNSSTPFQLGLAGTPQCNGDTAGGGYNWSTFLVPQGTDLATVTFTPLGPSVGTSLLSTGGSTIAMQSTNLANTAGGPGLITGIPAFTFEYNLPGEIAAGAYDVGIACTTSGGSVVDTYWSRPMTITENTTTGGPAQIDWSQGEHPASPAITAVNSPCTSWTTLSVEFVAPVTDPPVSAYTLTATPQGGGMPIVQTGSQSPILISGLSPGTTYDLELTATNALGTSIPATATAPTTECLHPPLLLSATPAIEGTTLTWSLPVDSPTGFELRITDALGGPPTTVTLPSTVTSYFAVATRPGCGQVRTFTLTPLYNGPVPGSPSSVTSTAFCESVLIQDITTVRPVGALVLTQRCGVYGELPAEGAQLGFPAGLDLAPGVNSSTVEAPVASTGPNTPTVGSAPWSPTGPGDPVRDGYPYPTLPDGTPNPTYPTHCGIDLGAAQFVTSGAGAGQFFAADGRLNQVTVVDTRDGDLGWNVVGQVSNFTAGPGKSFSGSQLGWTPVVTEDTATFVDSLGNSYDQVTAAGAAIAPNTAVASGLSSNRTLISANAFTTTGAASGTGGLGTAIADARLKLLIPVTAQSGTYTATLTISVL